ncbi:MAG: hypothetical protein BKP49_02970 [Treponema sp. CETP13]|nr:MAG: hypothetical protein BKP49_02970 [Treponema sp. CETP13]
MIKKIKLLKKYTVLFYIFSFFILSIPAWSQDMGSSNNLPDGYRLIHLGMTIEETKQALENDAFFGYRGDRDVSLLPSENKTLIETTGSTWLERSWFQFYNDKLYTIIINFNPAKLDYYSIFTTISNKYGDPKSLSPERTIWENDSVRLTLEQPCSVKYIDMVVFNELLDQSTVEKSTTEILRQNLLDDF